jgi:hypothetical protein
MWTVQQIVEEVSKRTERRADQKINLRMEFFLGLDEFVSEQHFWWRKKRGTFQTVIGANMYDLSMSAASGTIQPGGGISDFAQFDEIILLNADGITKQLEIVPILDPVGQLVAIKNTVQDVPAAFFIDPQISPTTVVFQAPASVAQTVLYTYWAVPQISEPDEDTIPMVPSYLHWGLVYMLERRVYEFLYGEDDPRFTVANSRYMEFCQKAARMPHWTAKRVQEMRASSHSVKTVQAHN